MVLNSDRLLIGDILNGISLYIIESYDSFETWKSDYKNESYLMDGISNWFYLELSDMIDIDEISLEELEEFVSKFVEENFKELLDIIERLYKLNKKYYVRQQFGDE